MLHKYEPKVEYEYIMPAYTAKKWLDVRKGDELKMNPWDYLCEVVNKYYGLNRKCSKVTVLA